MRESIKKVILMSLFLVLQFQFVYSSEGGAPAKSGSTDHVKSCLLSVSIETESFPELFLKGVISVNRDLERGGFVSVVQNDVQLKIEDTHLLVGAASVVKELNQILENAQKKEALPPGKVTFEVLDANGFDLLVGGVVL